MCTYPAAHRSPAIVVGLSMIVFLSGASCRSGSGPLAPGPSGGRSEDPYRWLENLEAERTRSWVANQAMEARRFLDGIPQRSCLERQLRDLADSVSYGSPRKAGDRYFYIRTEPGRSGVLYAQRGLQATPRVLVDPNLEAEDGSLGIGAIFPSPSGAKLLYSVTDGSRRRTLQLLDVETLERAEERIEGQIWSSSVAWLPDESGFYYDRYDLPRPGEEISGNLTHQRLLFHELGTDPAQDVRIHASESDVASLWGVQLTEDGDRLVFHVTAESTTANGLCYVDLRSDARDVVELLPDGNEAYRFVGGAGSLLWVTTTDGAPDGRLIRIDLERPDRAHWQTVIPERDDMQLISVTSVGRGFAARYQRDVLPLIELFDRHGNPRGQVPLPGVSGYVAPLAADTFDDRLLFDFRNTAHPGSLYVYDARDGDLTTLREPEGLAWDPGEIELKQVFYESRDGTRIPMYLLHGRNTTFAGDGLFYMPGYGAGGFTMAPAANPLYLWLARQGGGVAIPGLRGGGEYGRPWHEAGKGRQKPNTIDDFIAAAEWLIDHGYTRPSRLIAQGMSAGGTVPAAAANRRPDLFGAVIPAWPVLDMIRFTEFSGGDRWVTEYGSPDDPGTREVLLRYSPYHNVRPGVCYPPTLVVTGDRDDAATPAHAYKYVARLQAAQACEHPVLLDVVPGGRHMPTSVDYPAHLADWLAFTMATRGLELPVTCP